MHTVSEQSKSGRFRHERLEESFEKILYPPIWLLILLGVVSAVMLPLVFIKEREEAPIAYAVYVLAFYTVTVLSVFLVLVLPKQYKKIKQKVYGHTLGNQFKTDAAFKARISLYTSLTINLAYSAFKMASGIYYHFAFLLSLRETHPLGKECTACEKLVENRGAML